MDTTAPFPSFEPLVKPFKFAASPYEYKVTALRGRGQAIVWFVLGFTK